MKLTLKKPLKSAKNNKKLFKKLMFKMVTKKVMFIMKKISSQDLGESILIVAAVTMVVVTMVVGEGDV